MCKKVSVVVPVYNAEKYIESCIQSVLDQDYQNIELVLINDGSRDNSGAVCERYAEKYENIIYSAQENSGVSSARNKGIALSSGEYVMFVDSDDRIKSNMVSKLFSALEENGADLSICGYELLRSDGVFPVYVEPSTAEGSGDIAKFFAEHFLEAVASSPFCKLYKRSLISEGFDPELSMGEDLLFNLGYIKNIKKVTSISDSLYIYDKTNGGSITNNYKLIYHRQTVYVMERWLEWLSGFEGIDDIYVHHRIVTTYINYLSKNELTYKEKKSIICQFDLEKLAYSVKKVKHQLKRYYVFVFGLILNKRFKSAALVLTVRSKLHKLGV